MEYFRKMSYYSKRTKTKYWLLFLITMLFSIVNGASSYYSKVIIDLVNNKADKGVIFRICILIIVAYLLISVLNIYKSYLSTKVNNNLEYGIKGDYFNMAQKSMYLDNINKESSEIYYRMSYDINLMSSYFVSFVIAFPTNMFSLFFYAGIMFRWSIKLTVFVILMSVVQVAVSNYNRSHIEKTTTEVINSENNFVKEIGEHFRAIEVIKTLGLEEYKLIELNKTIDWIKKAKQKSVLVLSLLNFISGFIGQIASVGVLLLGSILIFNESITIGTYVGFTSMMVLFFSTINNLVEFIFGFEAVKVSYKRYSENYENYCKYEYEGDLKFKFEKSLEIKKLFFSYSDNKKILKNINLILKPGTFIAITGDSGVGKSTLAKLIIRLIEPSSGEILIDGINIRRFEHQSFKKNVSYFTQLPFIFEGSIKDNICIGVEAYDEEYFDELIKKTGIDKLVDKMELGLDTKIGKNGIILSVGEAQRICIARVLLKKPKIVVLDEPTSSLNEKLDFLVSKLFREFSNDNGSLVILISHKESSLEGVDCVYNLNELI